ncbi:hypothetical protein J3F84DRAFT_356718 [Trichoderma pleuroticola]
MCWSFFFSLLSFSPPLQSALDKAYRPVETPLSLHTKHERGASKGFRGWPSCCSSFFFSLVRLLSPPALHFPIWFRGWGIVIASPSPLLARFVVWVYDLSIIASYRLMHVQGQAWQGKRQRSAAQRRP